MTIRKNINSDLFMKHNICYFKVSPISLQETWSHSVFHDAFLPQLIAFPDLQFSYIYLSRI